MGQVDELSALPNFRVRILPVLGPLPAMVCHPLLGFRLDLVLM